MMLLKKIKNIFLNAVPVLVMIGLIPIVENDYWLAVVYGVIITVSLFIKNSRNDLTVLIFGFVIMIVSESIFTSTGVETFNRISLFGLMPLWLPFLWAYGFVAIKRSVEILNK